MSRPTLRSIFVFWVPLAATWLMMASEGPFLAAVIARLADPKFNLASHGVAFAFAILVEAPVIMLMSAATALVEDSDSFRRLRNFTRALNAFATTLLLVVLIPAVYDGIMRTALGLPTEVAELTYGALWLLLPWPGAIGYRRFLHGLLIRSGRTRLVALGTVLRLSGMAVTALLLYFFTELPGAWVGASALSAGVVAEAIATHLMARPTVRELEATPRDPAEEELTYQGISAFYWPLALTAFLGLTVQPLLTFFMGRAPHALESLAVFPVVQSLSFFFRAAGLSFQEAAIALLGKRGENAQVVGRFGLWLGMASSGALALVAFTPLSDFWFVTVSGLEPELAAFAKIPTMVLVPLPAMSVLLSYQRAVVVQDRRTGSITVATALEVVLVAVVFAVLGWRWGIIGVTAAFAAFLVGRLGGNLYMMRPVERAKRSLGRSALNDSRAPDVDSGVDR